MALNSSDLEEVTYQITSNHGFGDGVMSVNIDSKWSAFTFLVIHCYRKATESDRDAWLQLAHDVQLTRYVIAYNLSHERPSYRFVGPDGEILDIFHESRQPTALDYASY